MTLINLKPLTADDLEYEVTFTMTLRDLKRLEEQLDPKYPSAQIRNALRECVRQAEKNFQAETKKE